MRRNNASADQHSTGLTPGSISLRGKTSANRNAGDKYDDNDEKSKTRRYGGKVYQITIVVGCFVLLMGLIALGSRSVDGYDAPSPPTFSISATAESKGHLSYATQHENKPDGGTGGDIKQDNKINKQFAALEDTSSSSNQNNDLPPLTKRKHSDGHYPFFFYGCDPDKHTCISEEDFMKIRDSRGFHEVWPIISHIKKQDPELLEPRCAVGIGVATGTDDPTWKLFHDEKWTGVAVEGGEHLEAELRSKLDESRVDIKIDFITPKTIKNLTQKAPRDCTVLKMDIDGYDCQNIRVLLSGKDALKPKVVFMEVWEDYPPPVEFSVLYHKGYIWGANGHAVSGFAGCSLGYAEQMLKEFGFHLLFYYYNNAVFVHSSISHLFQGQIPVDSARMYRENKPSFQNAAFKRMNNKWVQEKDMCKLYDSVLCYVMKERTKATYHQDPKALFASHHRHYATYWIAFVELLLKRENILPISLIHVNDDAIIHSINFLKHLKVL